jgi:hypothetical protein
METAEIMDVSKRWKAKKVLVSKKGSGELSYF